MHEKVLSLIEGKSLVKVWRQCYLWSFPYYLAGATIAGLFVSSGRVMAWTVSLLILLLMYMVYVFYRLCVERIAQHTPTPPFPDGTTGTYCVPPGL